MRPLYAFASFEIRPPGMSQPRQDEGFGLTRRYQRLDGDNHPSGGDLTAGDRVLVTLELSVREPARYVVVDDPLPAILEPLPAGSGGDEWMWNFHEFRKDRVLFFADWMSAGNYTLIISRASAQLAKPMRLQALMEEMYHPRRFGLTGAPILWRENEETRRKFPLENHKPASPRRGWA